MKMNNTDHYYQVLGLSHNATPRELKQAYLNLVKVWHPDRFVGDIRLQEKAQEKLREINEAYAYLKKQKDITNQYTKAKPHAPPQDVCGRHTSNKHTAEYEPSITEKVKKDYSGSFKWQVKNIKVYLQQTDTLLVILLCIIIYIIICGSMFNFIDKQLSEPNDSPTPRDFYFRAIDYASKGNVDDAIKNLNQAINLKSDFADAYYKRGYIYQSKGDLEKAIADYNMAIENSNLAINPSASYIAADAYYGRGYIYQSKGDLEKAIADYNMAIKLNSQNPFAFYNRGLSRINYYKLNYKLNYDNPNVLFDFKVILDSINDYTNAIKLKPDYAEAYFERGNAYLKKGEKNDLNRAIANFTRVININRKYVDAYISRGDCYLDKGKKDKAFADYNKAIKLDSKNARAYNNRGVIFYANEEFINAYNDFSKAIALDPSNDVYWYNRGAASFSIHANALDSELAEGDLLDAALADFDRAIQLNNNCSEAYYGRGLVYFRKNEADKGVLDFKMGYSLNMDLNAQNQTCCSQPRKVLY